VSDARVRVEWNGPGAEALVRTLAVRLLRRVCILVTTRAKRLLSVPGTGRVKGRRAGPVTHAPAGEPPFKQTGRGRASVTYEVDEAALTARAGTNVEYMKHQELGTKRGVRPHPWLRRAVAECASQIKSLMSSPR
jgi:hypothetical protein